MGIVLTVELAVVADGILVILQRVLTPWARRRRTARRRRVAPTPAEPSVAEVTA